MLSSSTESLKLILPWPPSVNHYKKVGAIVKTRSGKFYQKRVNTNETKMFYWNVYQQVKKTMPLEGYKFYHDATIRVEVMVSLHPPSDRRYDIDNRLKVLLDGLTRAKVLFDDSQITRLFVEKMDIVPEGQVIVHLREFERGVMKL